MAHVELSLSESLIPKARPPAPVEHLSSLERWAVTVVAAAEPCLVTDADGMIVAVSMECCRLLGLGCPAAAAGTMILEGALRMVDFTAARGELTPEEAQKIPPLLAVSSGRLARGLMRVHDGCDLDTTVDAIATPLLDGEKVAGSLTFFSAI